MPTFCRHNRLLHNCPICSREQQVELRPLVSSGTPGATEPRSEQPVGHPRPPRHRQPRREPGLRVRRLDRGADDGYRSALAPGLKSSVEAERLAEELAFGATRLGRLKDDPPGLYAEIASADGDLEERTWLAFLTAYLGPLDAQDPFAEIDRARTPWVSNEPPLLDGIATGPRSAHAASAGARTAESYRAWAAKAGSQASAYTGEQAWSPERRFARVFERLALPGLHRGARFELLVTLGWLGLYELQPGALALGGSDEVTLAAKRALGIGDPLLLERRAGELAEACGVELAALDLALYNWERGERTRAGLEADAEATDDLRSSVRTALAL